MHKLASWNPEPITSFAQLAEAGFLEDQHYCIVDQANPNAKIALLAIHGGSIEPNTDRCLWLTQQFLPVGAVNSYQFVSLLPFLPNEYGNGTLHITSTQFDDPRAYGVVSHCPYVVSFHGCKGKTPEILMGGRDKKLKEELAQFYEQAGLVVQTDGHPYKGINKQNICNRGLTSKGVQIELTTGLRQNEKLLQKVAKQTSRVLQQYL